MNKLPSSPFTTRLSGSAKETELRIRSIFQWKHRRPPAALLALMLAAALLCGNLVSCQVQPGDESHTVPDPSLILDAEPILDALQAAIPADVFPDTESAPLQRELLHTVGDTEGPHLAAARFLDGHGVHALVLAMVGPDGQVVGQPYITTAEGGRPYAEVFQKDGRSYLLYTANGGSQGYSYGEAGVVRLNGDDFSWVWPVEGDIRDDSSIAHADYNAYWADRKPLMAPGGLDIFQEDPAYNAAAPGSAQWAPLESQTFWAVPEAALPTGMLWQSRVWMETELPYLVSSNDGGHLSGVWQLVSLTPRDGVYPDRNFDGTAVYDLAARLDCDALGDRYFQAVLCYDHSLAHFVEVVSYEERDGDQVITRGPRPEDEPPRRHPIPDADASSSEEVLRRHPVLEQNN